MVTLNLLPWRALVREARNRWWRRLWPVPVILLLLPCLFFLPVRNDTPSPLPAPASPPASTGYDKITRAHREARQLQQVFSAGCDLIHAMDTRGVRLMRLQLQVSGLVLLEGEAPSPETWLAALSTIHHAWHPVVKSFHPATSGTGIHFTVSLRPPIPSLPLSPSEPWHAIQHPAVMLAALLGRSHGETVLTRLQLPEDDTGMALLQASGSLTTLITLIQRLVQADFFCPLHTLRLDDMDKTPALTLKWRYPCFQQHYRHRPPRILQALRLAGWLQDNKGIFAVLQNGDRQVIRLRHNETLPESDARLIRLQPHAVLIKSRTGVYCITDKGIQEDTRQCSAT